MVLTILHTLQYMFFALCAPLLGFLLYALFKNWRDTTPRLDLDPMAEYQRGYADGWADGHDAATSELTSACCSMSDSAPDTPSPDEDAA